jgi:hypothetical protein
MKITLKAVYEWDGFHYIKTSEQWFDYTGPVALACGATAAQNQIGQSQQGFMTQLQTQGSSVFGDASSVFNNLMSTLTPTIQAGPNQQGFSPQELSNLNSEAITQTGQAYQNAKAAAGNQLSAEGGGNTALPSGTEVGENLQLAESGANQTASELQGITEQNYATGRQNYTQALQDAESAPNVFNSSTSAANAATGAGVAASNTANQIASQQNSWMQLVTGALGGVAGGLTGGLTNVLGGLGGGGGNSASSLGSTGGVLSGLNSNYNSGPAPAMPSGESAFGPTPANPPGF